MAFVLNAFNNVSSGTGDSLTVWMYINTNDTLAQIAAAGYFDQVKFSLTQYDVIFVTASDGTNILSVTSSPPDTVTTDNFTLEGVTPGGLDYGYEYGPATFGEKFNFGSWVTGVTTTVGILDMVEYQPIVIPKLSTYTKIGITQLFAAGSGVTVRLGLYEMDAGGGIGDLVVDAGLASCETTGEVSIVISEALVGKYWTASVYGTTDSTSVGTCRGTSRDNGYPGRSLGFATSTSSNNPYSFIKTGTTEHAGLSAVGLTGLSVQNAGRLVYLSRT